MNKYTSYRVDLRPPTTTPGDVPQDVILAGSGTTMFSSVLRRYSDFLWLYERLHVERAGAIVPPLPEKQPVGRFSPSFVEERRVQLERFVRRIAVHPELADSPAIDVFLRADDVTFQAAKHVKGMPTPQQMMMSSSPMMMTLPHSPPKEASGFKRWFAETKTSITGDLVRSPDDDLFEEISRYIAGLDTQMRNVSQQASGLVRKGKEIANGLFEFGLAFNLLGQSEGDSLGDALQKMGATADQLSVVSAEHAHQEMAQFEEPLQDYIKFIQAVQRALHRRHEKRVTYSTCVAEVESKSLQLHKLRAQIGSEAKAYAMEMALRQAQEAAQGAQDDFATVSQRVLREVDRFKREKAEEMRWTVLRYITLQVEYNKRMETVWAALIPQLEGGPPPTVSPESSQLHQPAPAMQQPAAVQQQPPMHQQQQPPMHQQQQQPPMHQQQQQPPMHQQQQPPMHQQQQQPSMHQQQQPMIHQSHEIPQYDLMTASQMVDPSISIQYRDGL
jgi:sorting nexin-1/2